MTKKKRIVATAASIAGVLAIFGGGFAKWVFDGADQLPGAELTGPNFVTEVEAGLGKLHLLESADDITSDLINQAKADSIVTDTTKVGYYIAKTNDFGVKFDQPTDFAVAEGGAQSGTGGITLVEKNSGSNTEKHRDNINAIWVAPNSAITGKTIATDYEYYVNIYIPHDQFSGLSYYVVVENKTNISESVTVMETIAYDSDYGTSKNTAVDETTYNTYHVDGYVCYRVKLKVSNTSGAGVYLKAGAAYDADKDTAKDKETTNVYITYGGIETLLQYDYAHNVVPTGNSSTNTSYSDFVAAAAAGQIKFKFEILPKA